MTESFEQWLDRQYRCSAKAMLQSVSPQDVVKTRPGFGQTIRPAAGAIVASPVLAAYDPDPDYFFHWYRDSAVVLDAVRLLHADGTLGPEALLQLRDFIRFNLSLQQLDGRPLVASPAWRAAVAPDFARFVRDDAELAAVHGEAVSAETRVNPDGTLDISKWARPQHDGPPLRALSLLRWLREYPLDADSAAGAAQLIRADLAFAFRHWHEPSFDIWEEEAGRHYYTLRVCAAALDAGASWLQAQGDSALALSYGAEAAAILNVLDGFWLEDEGCYRSRLPGPAGRSAKELDIAVILSAIHAGRSGATHSVRDPRMHATLARLEKLFDSAYPINRGRLPGSGPAMGRYPGDVYYSGGAYYFSTLGAAEFCFRAAAAEDARTWMPRGDGFLATVRTYTPPDGGLSEQFDQATGAQTSAKQLAWSHAAFISCMAARRAAGR